MGTLAGIRTLCRPSARSASGDIAGLAHIRDASLQDIGEDVGIGQDWAPSLLRRPTVELSRSASLGRRSAGPSLGMHLVRTLDGWD